MSTSKKPYGIQYRDAVLEFAAMRGAKHAKLNVLRAILQSCNAQTGTAYPGNTLIMKRANTPSKDTLWRAITFLEKQGIIRRVAFPSGGRGRTVTWGFGLPAWTTPNNLHDVIANGINLPEKQGGIENENLPENASKPPRKCVKTSPKNGEPTKGTKNNSDGDACGVPERGGASRPANGHKVQSATERRKIKTVVPGEVRQLLLSWGFEAKDIDTFSEQVVRGLLKAEGFRLAA